MSVRTVLDAKNTLGEGPIWHQGRLFWCDIKGFTLNAVDADGGNHQSWDMGEHISAAAPLADGNLLVASETKLLRFDPATGQSSDVIGLEADNSVTRSNDGRADRRGGFWIGTMGKNGELSAGTIYRYFRGELRVLYETISTPNAMCFSPDGGTAYVADSKTRHIMRQPLDADGWPDGERQPFFQLDRGNAVPDGAVVDSEGHLWCALYRGSVVIRISPAGEIVQEVSLPATQLTCPAFGGPDLKTVFVTSARQGLDEAALAERPLAGAVFAFEIETPGLPDQVVELG